MLGLTLCAFAVVQLSLNDMTGGEIPLPASAVINSNEFYKVWDNGTGILQDLVKNCREYIDIR